MEEHKHSITRKNYIDIKNASYIKLKAIFRIIIFVCKMWVGKSLEIYATKNINSAYL